MDDNGELGGNVPASASAAGTPSIVNGPQAWGYLYLLIGFALSIESAVVEMSTPPLCFPWNLVAFSILAGLTVALLLNGRVQSHIFSLQMRYESRPR